jgi:5-methylcytosine-specific restriction enzyme A
MSAERFVATVSPDDLRREKARARQLRQTPWWKRRLAQGQCHYCRRQVGARALTMDHLVPMILGGRSIRPNLVPCCKDCNSKKKSLLAWQWDEFVQTAAGLDEG